MTERIEAYREEDDIITFNYFRNGVSTHIIKVPDHLAVLLRDHLNALLPVELPFAKQDDLLKQKQRIDVLFKVFKKYVGQLPDFVGE